MAKSYSVKDKVKHYSGVLSQAEKVKAKAQATQKDVGRVSYAAGYNRAVKDCREALKASKK